MSDMESKVLSELEDAKKKIKLGETLGAFNVLQDAQRNLLELLLIEVEKEENPDEKINSLEGLTSIP